MTMAKIRGTTTCHRFRKTVFLLVVIEALTIIALVLASIVLAAGTHDTLQEYSLITFDIATLKSQLTNNSNIAKHALPDWCEAHFLSICHGKFLHSNTQTKNTSSTQCTSQSGGHTFSLTQLLATDLELPVSSALLSPYSFAQISTRTSFICVVLAITSTAIATIGFFMTLVTNRNIELTSSLVWPRVGFLASLAAVHTILVSAADITAKVQRVLDHSHTVDTNSPFGMAWMNGALYALIWVAFGLLVVVIALEIVLVVDVKRRMDDNTKRIKSGVSEVLEHESGLVWTNEITEHGKN